MRKSTNCVSGKVLNKRTCIVTEACTKLENSDFKKRRDCTIYVAKTIALISCAFTAERNCAFVFAYACCCFVNASAH